MPTPPPNLVESKRRIAAIERELRLGARPPGVNGQGPGAIAQAAAVLGMSRQTLDTSLVRIKQVHGLEPDWSLYRPEEPKPAAVRVGPPLDYHALIKGRLRRGRADLPELAKITGLPEAVCRAIVADLHTQGTNIKAEGEGFVVTDAPPPAFIHGPALEIVSDKNHRFRIGVVSDSHLCSKYARLDVLNWEYDRFTEAGITHVLHAGNWIDGEASFNRHDLLVHGMDAQLRYLANEYPRRKNIATYAIAGDDHEGWYAQREGVDIGRYAEQVMRDAGRGDWHDLGYMESHVKLTNAKTGKAAVLALVHPGGGSAYADSYAIQKIIEVLPGGEKPAVGIYGHYHKLLAGEYRNVWWLQAGCTQDPTPFARKRKLRFCLGGTILEMEQDPQTGAIIGFRPDMRRYFDQGYYQGRWSHAGPVTQPRAAP